jgi:hypothetical protein
MSKEIIQSELNKQTPDWLLIDELKATIRDITLNSILN